MKVLSLRYIKDMYELAVGLDNDDRYIDDTVMEFPVSGNLIRYEPELNVAIKNITVKDEETNEYVNIDVPLTEDDIKHIQIFIDKFLSELDYQISAYREDGVYIGRMLKSEAVEKGYNFNEVLCDYPVGKFNNLTKTWDKVVAIITEAGGLILDPPSYCDRCYMFFIADEWKVFPKPEDDPTLPGMHSSVKYDFKLEKWVDGRTIQVAMDEIKSKINSFFSFLVSQSIGFYVDDALRAKYEQDPMIITGELDATENRAELFNSLDKLLKLDKEPIRVDIDEFNLYSRSMEDYNEFTKIIYSYMDYFSINISRFIDANKTMEENVRSLEEYYYITILNFVLTYVLNTDDKEEMLAFKKHFVTIGDTVNAIKYKILTEQDIEEINKSEKISI